MITNRGVPGLTVPESFNPFERLGEMHFHNIVSIVLSVTMRLSLIAQQIREVEKPGYLVLQKRHMYAPRPQSFGTFQRVGLRKKTKHGSGSVATLLTLLVLALLLSLFGRLSLLLLRINQIVIISPLTVIIRNQR
jgi:hypothetical protein